VTYNAVKIPSVCAGPDSMLRENTDSGPAACRAVTIVWPGACPGFVIMKRGTLWKFPTAASWVEAATGDTVYCIKAPQ